MNESWWLAICFIAFIYFTYRPVKRAIIAMLDAKVKSIQATLSEAEQLKQDAESLLSQVQQQLIDLQKTQDEMMHNAKISANAFIEQKRKEEELILERTRQEAEHNLQVQRTILYDELKKELINDTIKLVSEYFKTPSHKQNINFDLQIVESLRNK